MEKSNNETRDIENRKTFRQIFNDLEVTPRKLEQNG